MARELHLSHAESRRLARQLATRLRLPADACWLPAIGQVGRGDAEASLARWVAGQRLDVDPASAEGFDRLTRRLERRLRDWLEG